MPCRVRVRVRGLPSAEPAPRAVDSHFCAVVHHIDIQHIFKVAPNFPRLVVPAQYPGSMARTVQEAGVRAPKRLQ